MAGHSKWANIQHRKGKQDKIRAKVFTKLIREITTAARMSGMDPDANPRLRLAILKARESSMPNDTIERAVKRGGGNDAGDNYEAVTYEGYGPAGIAVYVECLTDNRNRTVSEVRHAFTKNGGNLGTDGSVAYLFSKKGQLIFSPDNDENQIMEIALEAGADDVETSEDHSIEVLTEPDQFEAVKTAFTEKNILPASAEITMIASNYVKIEDRETIEKVEKLLDMLEDLDDVQNVYSNADF